MERASQAFEVKLGAGLARGLSLEDATNQARGTFQKFLNDAQSASDQAWNGIRDEANKIAQTGSAGMIEAAAQAIREGKAPAEVEKMLQT